MVYYVIVEKLLLTFNSKFWFCKSFPTTTLYIIVNLLGTTLSISDGGLPGLAAVYQLKDLDSFIANTAVPPPPVTATAATAAAHAQSSTNAKASVADEESQVRQGAPTGPKNSVSEK